MPKLISSASLVCSLNLGNQRLIYLGLHPLSLWIIILTFQLITIGRHRCIALQHRIFGNFRAVTLDRTWDRMEPKDERNDFSIPHMKNRACKQGVTGTCKDFPLNLLVASFIRLVGDIFKSIQWA